MSKGPGLFSDIGKKPRDILNANYTTDHKFSINTCSESGVVLTSTAVKKGAISYAIISVERHLEKQNDLLMEAYRSMSHELHKLQVEEEMLMRKFYDIMESQSSLKKSNDKGASNEMGNGNSTSATRDDTQR